MDPRGNAPEDPSVFVPALTFATSIGRPFAVPFKPKFAVPAAVTQAPLLEKSAQSASDRCKSPVFSGRPNVSRYITAALVAVTGNAQAINNRIFVSFIRIVPQTQW